MTTARARLFAVAALAACAVACSAKEVPSPPPRGYQVSFASIDVAAAAETVEVLVYEGGSQRDGICNELVVKRHSNQGDQIKPLAQSAPVTPCDLLAGKGDKLTVSLGVRAFLGVARRAGQDYLIGCTVLDVRGGTQEPVIFLDYASSLVEQAKPTTCQSLSDHCRGAC